MTLRFNFFFPQIWKRLHMITHQQPPSREWMRPMLLERNYQARMSFCLCWISCRNVGMALLTWSNWYESWIWCFSLWIRIVFSVIFFWAVFIWLITATTFSSTVVAVLFMNVYIPSNKETWCCLVETDYCFPRFILIMPHFAKVNIDADSVFRVHVIPKPPGSFS